MPDSSALLLFYPGKPPEISVGGLWRFCDRLREAVATGGTGRAVRLRYGEKIYQDYETTEPWDGDESGGSGEAAEYPWDHAKAGAWSESWPAGAADEARQIYRGRVNLGNLPPKVSRGLAAARGGPESDEGFAPDTLSLRIDPVCPCTMETEELTAYGLVAVAFSGPGFVSWQPPGRYWKQARALSALTRAQAACRELLPVPPLDFLEPLKAEMGPLFLNRDEYEPGDWIASLSEAG